MMADFMCLRYVLFVGSLFFCVVVVVCCLGFFAFFFFALYFGLDFFGFLVLLAECVMFFWF